MDLFKKCMLVGTIVSFVSCSGFSQKEQTAPILTISSRQFVNDTTDLKKLVYAVKKDLVCGMPIKSGVADTAHYRGKLYGFCAKECKEAFVKDPGQYIGSKK